MSLFRRNYLLENRREDKERFVELLVRIALGTNTRLVSHIDSNASQTLRRCTQSILRKQEARETGETGMYRAFTQKSK